MRYERLATPVEQFGVLIEPPPRDVVQQLRHRPAPDAPLLDSSVSQLRTALRARLGLSGRVIATGHQVEFFHAGVLAKTILAAQLAAAERAAFVYLWVDSDLPKSAYLAVPRQTPPSPPDRAASASPAPSSSSPSTVSSLADSPFRVPSASERASPDVRREHAPIPGCDLQQPTENQPAVPRGAWQELFDSLMRLIAGEPRDALESCARAWLDNRGEMIEMRAAWPRTHAAILSELGLSPPRDLWMSELSGTPEFRMFAAHIALHAERFAADYNAAQHDYRRRHRVRNAQRPAPPLTIDAGRIELPFWAYRAGGVRRRLFVRRMGARLLLLAEREAVAEFEAVEFARSAMHQSPWPCEEKDWRIRPRALTLSAFMRLLVADLFIHGIGGAKYDEMMEDFCARHFGVAPAPACCVTATVRRYDTRPSDALRELRRNRHELRDAWHNPQRHFVNLPRELLARRAELLARGAALATLRRERRAAGRIKEAAETRERAERRHVHNELRAVRDKLIANARPELGRLGERVAHAEQTLDAARIAGDRECFFGLLSLDALQTLRDRLGLELPRSGPNHP